MALVETDSNIIEIEGREGGNVWRHDANGQHIYAYELPTNKAPSELQTRRRNAFLQCVNFWKYIITSSNRLEWQNYATRHPTTNTKGETITLTAYQMFMHINIYRAYNNVSLLSTPPND